MDDIKRTYREGEDKAKESWRKADGEDITDDLGNAGDEARKHLGNAGDTMRREADETDEKTDRPY
jgi:hypothetical protein